MRLVFASAVIWTMAAAAVSGQVPQTVLYPDLTGNALLEQIRAEYKPATVYNYNTARDSMFSRVFNADGIVTCVYTGDTIAIPYGHPSPRTIANANVPNWSTEHVFPQSMGALTGNANSDMHHLMPVRQDANASRSNTPFGFVPPAQATIWWGPTGSQTTAPAGDPDLWSRGQGSFKFEPRTAWKGDVARAAFYFFTMYTVQANSGFFHGMMADLRAFHSHDVVDMAEVHRTWSIAAYQNGKPNPFIIDTTLVRRIFFTNYTVPVTGGSPDTYVADMEEASKTAYAVGNIQINGQGWELGEVLIGTAAGDMKTGMRSMRFQHSQTVNTYAQMTTNREQGVGTVTFDYARSNFTGDRLATSPQIVVEVFTNGEWSAVGDPVDLNGVDVLTTKTITVQAPGPSRIRFRTLSGTTGRRFNIDNIVITAYVPDIDEASVSIAPVYGWRMLTTPIATTFRELLDPVWTQGAAGSDAPTAEPNVYRYTDGAFTAVTDLNDALQPGEAFLYGHFNDDDYDGTPNSGPSVLTVTGALSTADVEHTPPTALGLAFTLAGNPYAQPVDFDLVSRTEGGHDKVWVFDPELNRYLSRASGLGDYDGHIHPFQGVWFEYEQNAVFGFGSNALTPTAVFHGKAQPGSRIVLRLDSGDRSDRAWVGFRADADIGLERYDAAKLTPLNERYALISTVADGKAIDIQFLPDTLQSAVVLPLDLKSTENGASILTVDELSLPAGWSVWLRDHETGERMALSAGVEADVVPVRIQARAARTLPGVIRVQAEGETRYGLEIDPGRTTGTPDAGRMMPQGIALEQNFPNPFNPTTVIRFTVEAHHDAPHRSTGAHVGTPHRSNRAHMGTPVRLAVYDVLGREVAVLVHGLLSSGSYSVNFDASKLPSGLYLYKLEAGGETRVRRMMLVK